MTAVTITTQVSGTPDTEDKLAWKFLIERENARRSVTGETLLLSSTVQERRASVETILSTYPRPVYLDAIQQAVAQADNDTAFRNFRTQYADATTQKQQAAIAAGTAALQ